MGKESGRFCRLEQITIRPPQNRPKREPWCCRDGAAARARGFARRGMARVAGRVPRCRRRLRSRQPPRRGHRTASDSCA
eukprot:6137017-Prymnesium_polylepis.1